MIISSLRFVSQSIVVPIFEVVDDANAFDAFTNSKDDRIASFIISFFKFTVHLRKLLLILILILILFVPFQFFGSQQTYRCRYVQPRYHILQCGYFFFTSIVGIISNSVIRIVIMITTRSNVVSRINYFRCCCCLSTIFNNKILLSISIIISIGTTHNSYKQDTNRI